MTTVALSDSRLSFKKPPSGYGIVPFYWWVGEPLSRERIAWHLEQIQDFPISGIQINYAHGIQDGGIAYGLSIPSDPVLFSPEWWELYRWTMSETKKMGASLSLSDYTLGIGQGWILDEILRDFPQISGSELTLVKGRVEGALWSQSIALPEGKSEIVSVIREKKPVSFDPTHPLSGQVYTERFFGLFEKHFPGEAGKGLNFFFSDELIFGLKGFTWNDDFAAEFIKRKGYDIVPELGALFVDIGPRTPKIRLDYNDVRVALSEAHYFKPIYDWNQKRGMTHGCDHGGRGTDVIEFGDYFRTQRWNQGPGADQPLLGKHLIKAKVASSIAHLYERPRVWLEGFYSSGWGTTSEGLIDATFCNFVMGFNLLSLHGMYYTTYGGWWDWPRPITRLECRTGSISKDFLTVSSVSVIC